MKNIESGVPQGSILGPTLFNVYINDMPHNNQHNNCALFIFADDTLLTGQSTIPEHSVLRVQNSISMLEPWLQKWRIEINPDKFQAVLYSKQRQYLGPYIPRLAIFGQPINWTPEAKHLGVILDRKLLFREHIESTLNKGHAALKRLYPLINRESHIVINVGVLYKALLWSILTYASPVWGHGSRSAMRKLQIFQNKVLRIVTKLPRITPRYLLQREVGIESISEFIIRLTQNLYRSTNNHTNPLVSGLGRYEHQNDRYRRPKSILLIN